MQLHLRVSFSICHGHAIQLRRNLQSIRHFLHALIVRKNNYILQPFLLFCLCVVVVFSWETFSKGCAWIAACRVNQIVKKENNSKEWKGLKSYSWRERRVDTEKEAKHLASVVPGENSQQSDQFGKIKPQITIPVFLKLFKFIKDSTGNLFCP